MSIYRDLFSLPDGYRYLNCAYLSPLSKRVEQTAVNALVRRRTPSTIGVGDFFDPADSVRSLFTKILGSEDPARIALIPSASYGMAIVARNVEAGSGQKVILVEDQFPSSVYTWKRFCAAQKCDLELVQRPDPDGHVGQTWNEMILTAIDSTTAVIALPHVHWTDGTVFDLESIGREARRVGAKLIVDGTQSVGAYPLDFQAVRPDAVICAGYKWLTGNMGLGVAYLGECFDDGVPLEENWIGRANSRNFSSLVQYVDEYVDGAARYDVGERGIGLLLPVFVEALSQVSEWGTELIQSHCRTISKPGLDELRNFGAIVPDDDAPSHLFGIRFRQDGIRDRLLSELKARDISVSLRGDAIRVAPYLYNSEDDVSALVDACSAAIRL
ncbi:MAG: aminotransferase class V-fold PLP-dependent enzyme [Rhodothermales bacterium]|nr:aminotransferase class V-fold PLP-dependent enzyme [Rhodothermales bacterium]